MPERKRRAQRHEEPRQPIDEVTNDNAAERPLPADVVATNTGVRLACTMAAMIGLFAVFLCFAEKESRVIRRFAVQSAALTALHALVGCAALALGLLLDGIPYIGLMVTLMCWIGYIGCLAALIFLRVRLMDRAWQGRRFTFPAAAERLLKRYY